MKKNILLLLILLFQCAFAQEKLSEIQKTEITFRISGGIIDSKTDSIISNADLYLMNCNNSVVANSKGEFQFNIPKSSFNDKLIISVLGYYSDTISVSQLEKTKNEFLFIKLNKETNAEITLNGLVVLSAKSKAKSISAKSILKKAKENIEDNYFQEPFNQKFFFRAQTNKDSLVTVNEEASIQTYSPNGIKVSDDAVNDYYGEILQFGGDPYKIAKENWKGIGYFGVVIFRNILLSNRNVLYETSSFDLKKEGTLEYNGKKVYVISFTNLAPDVFSTGFGDPSPKSVTGFIYIDTISFAVVKFEQYVVLTPYRPNESDDIRIESTLKITQTYKLVNGKYFINYCNEKVEDNYYSKTDRKLVSKSNTNYDLMSVDINTDNVEIITRPIDRLKLDVKLKEDPEYWKNNNFILEEGKVDF
ncbi:carboxypeptidase-like regulatory domain-containing protein [Flavobacterium laiguense]|uniref:Carboxypeptidase-like regulatory domain-containing protein n=1 Tax=Flavobacterium laiguense TaxID=2169409 RepID=A0A2U1K2U7_9FLAO|nr:carboxypeptidase-like regulatory domain-containing protein [Flavobacterium laiguense]PWA11303.1 hypothetical protein DB891_00330 [Flavobacterium laiguense]